MNFQHTKISPDSAHRPHSFLKPKQDFAEGLNIMKEPLYVNHVTMWLKFTLDSSKRGPLFMNFHYKNFTT